LFFNTKKPAEAGFLLVDRYLIKCYIELTNINNIMNKYEKWYNQITARGQTRITNQRTESHHIIPKCLGGSDDTSNLTNVTLREHFICHWLLTKIHQGKHRHQMLKALWMMRAENQNQTRYNSKITSRVYAKLKEEYSVLQSQRVSGENNPMWGKTQSEKARALISQKNTGKKLTEEQIAKQIAAQTGRKRKLFSQEWLDNMSKSKQGENNPNFGKKTSDKTRELQREKAIGRKQSAETVQKKADAVRGSKREKKLCPHCDQQIAVNTYPRFHGDKCRHRGQP
jgi:hypothetical protein